MARELESRDRRFSRRGKGQRLESVAEKSGAIRRSGEKRWENGRWRAHCENGQEDPTNGARWTGQEQTATRTPRRVGSGNNGELLGAI